MKQPTTPNTPNPAGKIADVFQPVDLRKVKVGGELGRRMDITATNNLLKINLDKDFLGPFVTGKYTGMNDGTGGYLGTGCTLDGMVRLAANTRNPELLARKDSAVKKLLASQGSDGYIGFMPPDKRTWTLWDLSDQNTIIAALVSEYRLFGNRDSLAAAQRLVDYLIKRWPEKPKDWGNRLPIREWCAFNGLNFTLLSSLYGATREPRYLDFAAKELGTATWDLDIVIGRHGKCEGHSYAYLSVCLAQLELYRLRPDDKLLAPTRRAVDFMTRKDGMTITGGVGQFECWTNDQRGNDKLGETCSTAWQIYVFDSLMRLEGLSRWGDLIERNLYNAAFGAQSPDGRQLRYYVPFEGKRVYFGPDSYCCPGSFRLLMGRLPELVYYRTEGGGAVVNLYVASEATIGEGDEAFTIRQETDYPTSGKVAIHVAPAKSRKFPVLLRIPRWCVKASVTVNGKSLENAPKAGEFLRIEREWKAGDQIDVDFPMPFRFVAGRKAQAGRAAIMRGPVVYTLNPAKIAGADPVSDLKRLVLLPDTAELVSDDKSMRPGGTACQIKADLDKADKGAYTLTLTEFPDPDGQWTYFQLADPKAAVEDELMTGTK